MTRLTVGQTDIHPAAGEYCSAGETLKHIHRVRDFANALALALIQQVAYHDASKLGPDEKATFDEATPRLRALAYGSPEYRASLASIRPALQHHYKKNSHHPEHYPNGIAGMSLIDFAEMLADWRAAGERQATSDTPKALLTSRDRFQIEPQLFSIIVNTFQAMGWIERGAITEADIGASPMQAEIDRLRATLKTVARLSLTPRGGLQRGSGGENDPAFVLGKVAGIISREHPAIVEEVDAEPAPAASPDLSETLAAVHRTLWGIQKRGPDMAHALSMALTIIERDMPELNPERRS